MLDKVAILASKLGTLLALIWQIVAFVFRFPFSYPIFTFGSILLVVFVFKRNDLRAYPIYEEVQNLLQALRTYSSRRSSDPDIDLSWSQTTMTHLVGQYCSHHLDGLRLSSGFYIGSCDVRQSWITSCAAQKTKSLILRGDLKATLEIEIRHQRFHGDWRGFVKLQGNFLIYHGRETGLDVQFNRVVVQSRVTEDVPHVDNAIATALQRGFQLPNMSFLQRTSKQPKDRTQESATSSQSSVANLEKEVKIVKAQPILNAEEHFHEQEILTKRSPRNSKERPAKPKRPNRPSKSSTSEVHFVKAKCFVLYHQWDTIQPRLIFNSDMQSKVFGAVQSVTSEHVWEFPNAEQMEIDARILHIDMQIKEEGQWMTIAKGQVDLVQQNSHLITIELADDQEAICELSLQLNKSSRKAEENKVLFDDRVQFSPSKRRDIVPREGAQRASVVFGSETASESSTKNHTSLVGHIGSGTGSEGGSTAMSSHVFATESGMSKHGMSVDSHLIREICRVHVTAKKDELGELGGGAVTRMITPSPVPSLQKRTAAPPVEQHDDEYYDDENEDYESPFVRGGGRRTFPEQSRPTNLSEQNRLTDSLPDLKAESAVEKSQKGASLPRPKSEVFNLKPNAESKRGIKKSKSKQKLANFFNRFRPKSRSTSAQRSATSSPKPRR